MAAGYRFFYDSRLPTYGYGDVRSRAEVLDAVVAWLVALDIGWSVYKSEYTSTDYTNLSCYYRVFLRYKDSDHLIRFYVQGSTNTSYFYLFGALMQSGLSESAVLKYFSSNLGPALHPNVAPYPLSLGLTAFFGGDSWTWLQFHQYTTATVPAQFLEGASYGLFARTAVQINDPDTTDCFVGITSSDTQIISFAVSPGYQTGSNTAAYTSGTPDNLIANNTDFEIIRDLTVSGTKLKLKDTKLFTNSFGLAAGTVLTINSEKWIILGTNQIAKIYDPA